VATIYFAAGLVLIAVAVGVLAGPWWGVLALGVELLALGVLEQRGAAAAAATTEPAP
jgi:hypothetical protein